METKGTKQIVELIDGLAIFAKTGLAIAKDGQINVADLVIAMGLLKEHQTLIAAFDGISEIPDEIKDLSLEEAQGLLTKLIAVVAEVKA